LKRLCRSCERKETIPPEAHEKYLRKASAVGYILHLKDWPLT
jgi:hypothetical protein